MPTSLNRDPRSTMPRILVTLRHCWPSPPSPLLDPTFIAFPPLAPSPRTDPPHAGGQARQSILCRGDLRCRRRPPGSFFPAAAPLHHVPDRG
ncbi:hypothetical protein ACHAWF_001545 [Thalassiosira exigua]